MAIDVILDNLSVDALKEFAQRQWVRLTFTTDARINFYDALSLNVDNGDSLEAALRQQQEILKPEGVQVLPSAVAVVVDDCLRTLVSGGEFAEALSKWVSVQEASLIAAGESTGKLVEGLDRAVQSLERRQELVSTVQKALAYPVAIGVGIVMAIFYIASEVVPELLLMQPKESYPAPTQKMIGLGEFFLNNWGLLLIAFVLSVAGIMWALPNLTGKLRDRLDTMPIFSTYRVFVGTTFLLNVAALLGSGVALEQALIDMGRYANAYLKERINDTLRGIRTGANFGQALQFTEHNFPDRETVRNIRGLAEKKGFAQALDRFTKRWLKRNMKLVERSSTVLRMVMLAIGGYVIVVLFEGIYGVAQRPK